MKSQYILWMIMLLSLCFTACSDDDKDEGNGGSTNGQLELLVDRNLLANDGKEQAHFTVKDGGQDVTSSCRIEEKTTGQVVNGGVFTSNKSGDYVFVAKWNNRVSNEVKVVVGGEVVFRKNMLMVVSTSVLCSFCPEMMDVIHEIILPKYPGRVQLIALHTTGMGKDPMAIRDYDEAWCSRFSVYEYPMAVLDYAQVWGRKSSMSIIDNLVQAPATVAIAVETALEGHELKLKARVRASEDLVDPCKIVVALTEDGIVAEQAGQGGGIIEHEWVARKYLTNLFGDYVEDNAIRKDNEYVKEMTYSLDAGWVPSNMHAIVCILDAKTGKVMNCQGVELGKSVGFEYLD